MIDGLEFPPFEDRGDAGRRLAEALADRLAGRDVVVLGLPRGGVPVAAEVANRIGAPLDVFLVRKVGVPGHEELAMGAIASGGVRIVNDEVVRALGLTGREFEAVTAREQEELARRERRYRGSRPPLVLAGRTAVLVDDGLATGSSMRAAIAAARAQRPAAVVVAVPVGARETCDSLGAEVDELVCLLAPDDFRAVGLWYRDFRPTTDEEVEALVHPSAGVAAG